MVIEGLTEKTEYSFYLIAGDEDPGSPKLDNQKFIKIITENTIEKPPEDFLDLFVNRFHSLIIILFIFL
jgi:hypothetical protein